MKNLILIAIAVFALQSATAQKPKMGQIDNMMGERMSYLQKLSAEEVAELQTKRMTLQLDLSETQIKKVYPLNYEIANLQKNKMAEMNDKGKPSMEDRYKMMMERLDHQIVFKMKFKAIFNDDQYEKFKEMQMKYFGHLGLNY